MKAVLQRASAVLAAMLVLAGPLTVSGRDGATEKALHTTTAVMCETVQQEAPVNPAVVFSLELGKVTCFTEFGQVRQQTVIHHRWYRKDSLISVKRLAVTADRRFSSSSMQLRDADKGPWRVDVTDTDDNLLATLRFSITD